MMYRISAHKHYCVEMFWKQIGFATGPLPGSQKSIHLTHYTNYTKHNIPSIHCY